MTNSQGTEWESDIVKRANAALVAAGRYPKRAQKDEPDVWIGRAEDPDAIPLVAWKRLTGKKGDGPRKPDGERRVVIMSWDDFQTLLQYVPHSFDVQAKWTVNLNVTRTLAGLRNWLKENR